MRTFKIVTVVLFGLLPAAPLTASEIKAPAIGRPKSRPENYVPQQSGLLRPPQTAAQYVGSDTCGECHADQSAFFAVTVHRQTLNERAQADQRGCEACHGPAGLHVEYYRTAQRLVKEGKDDDVNRLYSDAARTAGAMIIAGLLVELFSLHWAHPTSFLVFMIFGGALIGAGILFYLYSLVASHHR